MINHTFYLNMLWKVDIQEAFGLRYRRRRKRRRSIRKATGLFLTTTSFLTFSTTATCILFLLDTFLSLYNDSWYRK